MLSAMTESPQPVHKGSNAGAIALVVGIVVVVLCFFLAVCLGPFVLFAWFTDHEVDRYDEHWQQVMALAEYLFA
jgi:hypothetical protein